jgi:hypothetical protein
MRSLRFQSRAVHNKLGLSPGWPRSLYPALFHRGQEALESLVWALSHSRQPLGRRMTGVEHAKGQRYGQRLGLNDSWDPPETEGTARRGFREKYSATRVWAFSS